jgi:large subunit ribosomal protein L17
MRHRHGLRKLNRTSSHRLAMLRNMTNSLFTHEAIRTTLPKRRNCAASPSRYHHVEQESDGRETPSRVRSVRDRDVVVKLFDELGPRYKARPAVICAS